MFFAKYLSFALIAVGIFTAYMALVNLFSKDRNKLRAKQVSSVLPEQESENSNLSPLVVLLKYFLLLTGVDIHKQRDSVIMLSRAGYNTLSSLICFLFFRRFIQPLSFVVGAVILAKFFILYRETMSQHLAAFITGLLLVIIGGYGGKLFLSNSSQKRAKELIKSFPDALDLMLICVESGLGIDAAFARVCKEMKESHPIAASEFERTRFEMTMMSDRIQALQNFGDRTGVPAIRSLVSSLIQAEKFGTSLIDTMRTIAEEQRAERMMNAEGRAARLPALITLPLILFILPGLFMIILGPAYVKLQQQGGLFGNDNK
jgi:tight adherence protein C